MKRRLKKIFIAVLIIVLAFSLISCGKSEKSKDNKKNENNEVDDQKKADEIEKLLKTIIADYEMDYGILLQYDEDLEIIWEENGAKVYAYNDFSEFERMVNEIITDNDMVKSSSTGNYATAYIYCEEDMIYSFDISFEEHEGTDYDLEDEDYIDYDLGDISIDFKSTVPVNETDDIELVIGESGNAEDFIKIAGKYFNEIYPNIKITYRWLNPEDAGNVNILEGYVGNGPDLFVMNNLQVYFTKDNSISEVPDAAIDYVKDNCTELCISGATLNDADGTSKVYGYPISVDTYVLFYNKDIIDEKDVPKTMNELVSYIYNFEKSSGKEPFRFDAGNAYYSVMFTSSPSQHLYGPKGNDMTNTYMNSAQSVSQIETDFIPLSKAMGLESSEIKYYNNEALFVTDSLAMVISDASKIEEYENAKINFGIKTIPSLTGANNTTTNIASVKAMYVSNYSKNKNEAVAFAEFLMTEEMQKLRSEITKEYPANDKVIECIEDERQKELLTVISEQLKYAMPNVSEPKFYTAFNEAFGYIWDNNDTNVKSELDMANSVAIN